MRSSGDASADDAWPSDAVEVGRIVDAFGVKGWIKVQPHAADPQALFSSRRWWLQPPDEPRPKSVTAEWPSLLRIVQAKEHGTVVVAQVRDLAERDAALALRGGRVFVPRSSFPTAGDGEFYWIDLIGLAVVNRAGEALGTVAGLLDTGAHSVLRVQPPGDGEERLIPFVGAYVDGVDLADRRIRVDWGLDY